MKLSWVRGSMVLAFLAGGAAVHCGSTSFTVSGDAGTDATLPSDSGKTSSGTSSSTATQSSTASSTASVSKDLSCLGSITCGSDACCLTISTSMGIKLTSSCGSTSSCPSGVVELCQGLNGRGACLGGGTCELWTCAGTPGVYACTNPLPDLPGVCKVETGVRDAGSGTGESSGSSGGASSTSGTGSSGGSSSKMADAGPPLISCPGQNVCKDAGAGGCCATSDLADSGVCLPASEPMCDTQDAGYPIRRCGAPTECNTTTEVCCVQSGESYGSCITAGKCAALPNHFGRCIVNQACHYDAGGVAVIIDTCIPMDCSIANGKKENWLACSPFSGSNGGCVQCTACSKGGTTGVGACCTPPDAGSGSSVGCENWNLRCEVPQCAPGCSGTCCPVGYDGGTYCSMTDGCVGGSPGTH